MLIKWTETNEVGEEIVREHPTVTVKNADTYARKNHRVCHGRGYQLYDSGSRYETLYDEEGNATIQPVAINPRIIACDCTLRTLAKVGL